MNSIILAIETFFLLYDAPLRCENSRIFKCKLVHSLVCIAAAKSTRTKTKKEQKKETFYGDYQKTEITINFDHEIIIPFEEDREQIKNAAINGVGVWNSNREIEIV